VNGVTEVFFVGGDPAAALTDEFGFMNKASETIQIVFRKALPEKFAEVVFMA
jgi:hypothetical protein